MDIPEKEFFNAEKCFFPVGIPQINSHQELHDHAVSPWLGHENAQIFRINASGRLTQIELNLAVLDPAAVAVVTVLKVEGGLPSSRPEAILGRSEILEPLKDGWNTFNFPRRGIPLFVGMYAFMLETSSACDWRAVNMSPTELGTLAYRWQDEPWQWVFPPAAATYRAYIKPFEVERVPRDKTSR